MISGDDVFKISQCGLRAFNVMSVDVTVYIIDHILDKIAAVHVRIHPDGLCCSM